MGIEGGVRIEVHVFGGFRIELDCGNQIVIPNQKAKALVGHLALKTHNVQSREQLAGLLWSDRSEEQARASLRQTIRRLRVIFADYKVDPLLISRQEIGLKNGALNIDLENFIQKLDSGEVPRELLENENPAEKILYGYDDLGGLFSSWITVTRQVWSERVTKLLLSILRRRIDSSCDAAVALLNLDNTNEEVHRFLITHFADHGNTAGALNQYKKLWDILDADYDMEPAEETQLLIAAIKSGSYVTSEPLPDVAADKDVAVGEKPVFLPIISIEKFELHGLEENLKLRSFGLRFELLASLIKFRQWIIVEATNKPREEAHLHMCKPKTLQRLGYTLKGACYGEGENIRLVLTLRNSAAAHYIWSGTFVINVLDWSILQKRIVQQISVALNIHMSQQQLDQLVGHKNLPAETYDKWLQGQALSFVWRAKERDSAARIFLSIIDENPEFSAAYSSFVQLENTRHIAFPGVFRDKKREQKALEVAKIAVEHDPLDSRSQLCLAWSFAMNGIRDQAISHFWLARDLNENDPWTMISVAGGLSITGEIEEALNLANQSLSVNPEPSNSHWVYQATIHFLAEDYQGCIAASRNAGNTVFYLIAWEAAAYELLGKQPEAEARVADFYENVRANWHEEAVPGSHDIAKWLSDCIPIYDKQSDTRLRKSLQRIGIPISN